MLRTIALFRASWGLSITWLGTLQNRVALMSKIFGIVFPAIIIGLSNSGPIIAIAALDFIVQNILCTAAQFFSSDWLLTGAFLVFASLTAGSVLLVLILFKYMKTRRLTVRNAERSPWWASNQSKSISQSTGTNATNETDDTELSSKRQSIYDRALVTRFTIGFVLLA